MLMNMAQHSCWSDIPGRVSKGLTGRAQPSELAYVGVSKHAPYFLMQKFWGGGNLYQGSPWDRSRFSSLQVFAVARLPICGVDCSNCIQCVVSG